MCKEHASDLNSMIARRLRSRSADSAAPRMMLDQTRSRCMKQLLRLPTDPALQESAVAPTDMCSASSLAVVSYTLASAPRIRNANQRHRPSCRRCECDSPIESRQSRFIVVHQSPRSRASRLSAEIALDQASANCWICSSSSGSQRRRVIDRRSQTPSRTRPSLDAERQLPASTAFCNCRPQWPSLIEARTELPSSHC